MKTTFYVFVCILIGYNLNAQNKDLTAQFNGKYHLLEAERGTKNKPTKTKVVQFGKNNGTELLAIAACEKCMPAVYTFQKNESKKYGTPIFFNSMGLYVITFDEESFVIVLVDKKIGDGNWSKFAFSNFYSKNKMKVDKMTKQKIEEYAIDISKK